MLARLQSWPQWVQDAGLALLAGFVWFGSLTIAEAAGWQPQYGASYVSAGLWTVVALAGRRAAPLTVFYLILVGYPLTYPWMLVTQLHLLPIAISGYYVARAHRQPAPVTAVLAALGTWCMLVPVSDSLTVIAEWVQHGSTKSLLWAPRAFDLSESLTMVAMVVAIVLLGRAAHRQERARSELAARAAELERLQHVEAREAVAKERTQIARELHDVTAHHLSAMVVRAQAAARVAPTRPDAAVDAIEWIATEGAQALAAMRRTVQVLRDEDSGAPELAPGPTLGDVVEAGRRMRQAGLDVDVQIAEALPPLPAQVELTAVRITQEALTNVLNHSHARTAQVRVAPRGDDIVVTVRDPGPPRTHEGTRRGHGLTHMRERARACGGEVQVGPDGAAWVVRAVLPWRVDE